MGSEIEGAGGTSGTDGTGSVLWAAAVPGTTTARTAAAPSAARVHVILLAAVTGIATSPRSYAG
jgi:hypothetical protein